MKTLDKRFFRSLPQRAAPLVASLLALSFVGCASFKAVPANVNGPTDDKKSAKQTFFENELRAIKGNIDLVYINSVETQAKIDKANKSTNERIKKLDGQLVAPAFMKEGDAKRQPRIYTELKTLKEKAADEANKIIREDVAHAALSKDSQNQFFYENIYAESVAKKVVREIETNAGYESEVAKHVRTHSAAFLFLPNIHAGIAILPVSLDLSAEPTKEEIDNIKDIYGTFDFKKTRVTGTAGDGGIDKLIYTHRIHTIVHETDHAGYRESMQEVEAPRGSMASYNQPKIDGNRSETHADAAANLVLEKMQRNFGSSESINVNFHLEWLAIRALHLAIESGYGTAFDYLASLHEKYPNEKNLPDIPQLKAADIIESQSNLFIRMGYKEAPNAVVNLPSEDFHKEMEQRYEKISALLQKGIEDPNERAIAKMIVWAVKFRDQLNQDAEAMPLEQIGKTSHRPGMAPRPAAPPALIHGGGG